MSKTNLYWKPRHRVISMTLCGLVYTLSGAVAALFLGVLLELSGGLSVVLWTVALLIAVIRVILLVTRTGANELQLDQEFIGIVRGERVLVEVAWDEISGLTLNRGLGVADIWQAVFAGGKSFTFITTHKPTASGVDLSRHYLVTILARDFDELREVLANTCASRGVGFVVN